ncbi:protein-tyrosine phosphatase-related protein [Acidisarcina polymorpha]|uniref:Protein-tyrosine phosphatase-related protein n=1 Tax=Acidisarcina polymorpha TaxID=2211140 RepID=A0A2Z5G2L5_9BACT|nr:dual specificity protein phosphatase family protein [Acidisarcina polymorpha]AXC12776.1 protein-tyrosine phosphatase-related protein [Acidisarcina polymorpha]
MIVPYWIDATGLATTEAGTPPRLAIVPCPPGGEQLPASIQSLHNQGIDTLVSLLRADEGRVLRLEAEGRVCRELGVDYKWLPVQDHSIPESMDEFRLVVEQMQNDLRAGRGVGAHCYAGIGRSCLLMACLLCSEGLTPEEAFSRLSAARGLRVPDTWLQIQWVEHFAESLAGKSKQP